jgi:predicted Ser/Thr protein kinase
MKVKLSEVRYFQKIAGLLQENDSDILSKLQQYIANIYAIDQAYNDTEREEAKMENTAIENEIAQIKGGDYLKYLKAYAELEAYRAEYAGPEESEEIEQELQQLASKLGYSVEQLRNI